MYAGIKYLFMDFINIICISLIQVESCSLIYLLYADDAVLRL